MAARVEVLRALPDEPGYRPRGVWGSLAARYGELGTAVGRVIREAAARAESAIAQADQVSDARPSRPTGWRS
jgi:hypothetical protein